MAGLSEDRVGGFKYFSFAKPEPDPPRTPDIIIDPDGVLTPSQRLRAASISAEFYQLFTKRPGKYNGYYGRVANSLKFSSKPTPNSKVYLPNYSEKQLVEMGRLMDQLEDFGVLQRPAEPDQVQTLSQGLATTGGHHHRLLVALIFLVHVLSAV